MLQLIKKILFILFVALFGAGVGSYFSGKYLERKISNRLVNTMLYDLDVEMDILLRWKSEYEDDQILEKQIKHLILNQMSTMSSINPDISDFQGVPLNALYKLSIFQQSNKLSIKEYDRAFKTATSYLSDIEDDVNDAWQKKEKILRNPFKIGTKSGDIMQLKKKRKKGEEE